MHKPRLHPLLIVSTVLLLVLRFAAPVSAFSFDDDGHIQDGEVVDDDVILGGDTVLVEGTVNGDLIASGTSVIITGEVNGFTALSGTTVMVDGVVHGSLAIAAQHIIISGQVDGSLYAIGMDITLSQTARIRRNVLSSAFSFIAEQGSSIGHDGILSGGQIGIYGTVGRNLHLESNAIELGGTVNGGVEAIQNRIDPQRDNRWMLLFYQKQTDVPETLPGGLHLLPEAHVRGALTYTAPESQEANFESQPAGGVDFTQAESSAPTPDELRSRRLFGLWEQLLTLLVLGSVTLWRVPNTLPRLSQTLRQRPVASLGWGTLWMIVGFIALGTAALLILAVGIVLGVVALGKLAWLFLGIGYSLWSASLIAFLTMIFYGSKVVVAFWGGQWLGRFLRQNSPYVVLVIGVLVYVALRAVPVLGGVLALAVTLLGLGASFLGWRETRLKAPLSQALPHEE